ncbi:hypothetical protein I553_3092 [Mycobacterium xenopi 4042]|uniref:Uncharacterized protein n=1 Tax=Mycobacterium xenopi 4042 TaxID=1299334 RepID=X8E5T2_MYCXE|nr:hypothetical protein I553_3092 [Mycobacterium xenopi 4042]
MMDIGDKLAFGSYEDALRMVGWPPNREPRARRSARRASRCSPR